MKVIIALSIIVLFGYAICAVGGNADDAIYEAELRSRDAQNN